ncbi:MAG TPA: aminotransferase class V-fold PLP-dependent enzyme, partial [Anaerolineales bacterium]|nr:aminotransferase class V-fold PLP-dependent enzyme [Anaerolineales bacterium]
PSRDAAGGGGEPELLRWRSEFPILSDCVYLISNSLGAMPRSVSESLAEYAEAWGSRGVRAWEEGWWDMPVAVGDLVGRILGAPSGSVTMHQNVSIAEWIVLSALRPTAERRRVVYTSLNFPSLRYFYEAQSEIEPVVVPSPDGIRVPTERLLEAIDESTLLVPISHALYKSGCIQDVKAVIERAHAVGARVLLDVYQTCGSVPIDVARLGVDFAAGGSVKWLCGGPGAAFLYVRPDLAARLEPRLTGWMAHSRPFAFEETMEYAPSIRRFLHGTPGVPALYAARCGYEIILRVGVEKIRGRSLHLTGRLIDWADELKFPVHSPRAASQRAGHVTVNPPDAQRVSRELLAREFIIDYRPGAGIRIAPHFYNSEEEIDLVMREMERVVHSHGAAASKGATSRPREERNEDL